MKKLHFRTLDRELDIHNVSYSLTLVSCVLFERKAGQVVDRKIKKIALRSKNIVYGHNNNADYNVKTVAEYYFAI